MRARIQLRDCNSLLDVETRKQWRKGQTEIVTDSQTIQRCMQDSRFLVTPIREAVPVPANHLRYGEEEEAEESTDSTELAPVQPRRRNGKATKKAE